MMQSEIMERSYTAVGQTTSIDLGSMNLGPMYTCSSHALWTCLELANSYLTILTRSRGRACNVLLRKKDEKFHFYLLHRFYEEPRCEQVFSASSSYHPQWGSVLLPRLRPRHCVDRD